MHNGGLRGPSGRRGQRRRRQGGEPLGGSVEQELSASPILPAVAFAALGTVTVLLVALIGISPVGAVLGGVTRGGGLTVTAPRMSVSRVPAGTLAAQLMRTSSITMSRTTTRLGGLPAGLTVLVGATASATAPVYAPGYSPGYSPGNATFKGRTVPAPEKVGKAPAFHREQEAGKRHVSAEAQMIAGEQDLSAAPAPLEAMTILEATAFLQANDFREPTAFRESLPVTQEAAFDTLSTPDAPERAVEGTKDSEQADKHLETDDTSTCTRAENTRRRVTEDAHCA